MNLFFQQELLKLAPCIVHSIFYFFFNRFFISNLCLKSEFDLTIYVNQNFKKTKTRNGETNIKLLLIAKKWSTIYETILSTKNISSNFYFFSFKEFEQVVFQPRIRCSLILSKKCYGCGYSAFLLAYQIVALSPNARSVKPMEIVNPTELQHKHNIGVSSIEESSSKILKLKI